MAGTVYLFGPVTGLTFEKADAWRKRAKKVLKPYGIKCIDPMRSLKFLKKDGPISGTGREYKDELAKPAAVVMQNLRAVEKCDIMVGNLQGATRVSIGSVAELSWAFIKQKMVMAMVDEKEGNPHDHMHVNHMIHVKVNTFDALMNAVIKELGDPPKHSDKKKLKRALKKSEKKVKRAFKKELKKAIKKLNKKHRR